MQVVCYNHEVSRKQIAMKDTILRAVSVKLMEEYPAFELMRYRKKKKRDTFHSVSAEPGKAWNFISEIPGQESPGKKLNNGRKVWKI